jgi:hypothetical protein
VTNGDHPDLGVRDTALRRRSTGPASRGRDRCAAGARPAFREQGEADQKLLHDFHDFNVAVEKEDVQPTVPANGDAEVPF